MRPSLQELALHEQVHPMLVNKTQGQVRATANSLGNAKDVVCLCLLFYLTFRLNHVTTLSCALPVSALPVLVPRNVLDGDATD